jgi:hypothetical protein
MTNIKDALNLVQDACHGAMRNPARLPVFLTDGPADQIIMLMHQARRDGIDLGDVVAARLKELC